MSVLIAAAVAVCLIWFIARRPRQPSLSMPASVKGWKTFFFIAVVLILVFFGESILNFDWATTSLGRWMDGHLGSANWMWALLGVGAVVIYNYSTKQSDTSSSSGNTLEALSSFLLTCLFVAFVLWFLIVVTTCTGMDKKILGPKKAAPFQSPYCVLVEDVDGGGLSPDSSKCLGFYANEREFVQVATAKLGAMVTIAYAPSVNQRITKETPVETFFTVVWPGLSRGGSNGWNIIVHNDEFRKRGIQYMEILVTEEPLEPEVKYPLVEECTGEFAKLSGCKKVTLKGDAVYSRKTKRGMCIVLSPPLAKMEEKPPGSGKFDFSAKDDTRVIVHFFDLSVGETHNGFTCQ